MGDLNCTVLQLAKQFCEADFINRNAQAAVALCAENITWFGTGVNEDIQGLEEASRYIEREIAENPEPYKIEYLSEWKHLIDTSVSVAMIKLKISNSELVLECRLSISAVQENGVSKIGTLHMSVPTSLQEDNEYYPAAITKELEQRMWDKLLNDTITGGMISVYMEPGFPLYSISRKMLAYLGYEQEEDFVTEIGGLIANCIHPDDRTGIDEAVQRQIREKGQYTVDYRMRKKDGSYIWVHDSGQKIVDENSKDVLISVCYDITETKNAQNKLLEMMQNITCGIVVSKENPNDGSYEIQYMNEGFCKLFESTEEELRQRYGSKMIVGVHPKDLEKVEQMTAQLIQNRSHAEDTLRFLFPNGRIKWLRLEINAVVQPDGTTTTYTSYYDVTTQVQQEQQLRDVIHTVPGGVCLYRWDGKKLHPIIISEQFSSLLGEDAKHRLEETKDTEYIYVHPDDLPGLQRVIIKTFEESGKIEYTYRSRNRTTNEYRWLYMQGVTVPQADGTHLAYVSYTDVSDEHALTQNLRASERALDHKCELKPQDLIKPCFCSHHFDKSSCRCF